jgi:hypothetical protein
MCVHTGAGQVGPVCAQRLVVVCRAAACVVHMGAQHAHVAGAASPLIAATGVWAGRETRLLTWSYSKC